MLDRTIPFKNVILRCDAFSLREPVLPQGFEFRFYQPGDEDGWARLEWEIGDFCDIPSARRYFLESYGHRPRDLGERCLFVTGPRGEIAATCMAWYETEGDKRVFFLNWLAASPAHQNKGLGKAVFLRAMQIFRQRRELPVYIHTQPWSHKAILLYTNYGFRLMKRDTFCGYPNEYGQALAVLRGVMEPQDLERLEGKAK